MTYLSFLIWFLLPIIAMSSFLILQERRLTRLEASAIGALMLLAFTYTTPWDNWLVAHGIWTYASDAILLVIGYVPLQEYLFFLLQPLLTGLWTIFLVRQHPPVWQHGNRRAASVGATLSALTTLLGIACIAVGGHMLYAGLILAWAAPVLTLQWAVGGDHLWRNRNLWLTSILPPTVYLCLVDRTAILL
jgi:lycopene cyclase domain-containing protein